MTIAMKDEADVIDAHLAFHLRVGVDFVIATDTGSSDGTVEILERYAQAGVLRLLHDHSQPFRQPEVMTRMARLAASEFGADWVINSDADEFWWPRGSDLAAVLEALPPRYGIVRALWRPFVPRSGTESQFYERMTVRLAGVAPINDPTSPYRPNFKIVHRGDPDVRVGGGNHTLVDSGLQPLRGWYPFEVLHFQIRSAEHAARKYADAGQYVGLERAGYIRRAMQADTATGAALSELLVTDTDLERGLETGVLVVDTRLRDVLRTLADPTTGHFEPPDSPLERLQLEPPSVVDDALYAVEAAALDEANLVRIERRMDDLERRLQRNEARQRGWLGRRIRTLPRFWRRRPTR